MVFVGRLATNLHRVIVASRSLGVHKNELPQPRIEDFQAAIDQAGTRVRVRRSECMRPFRVNDRQAERYRNRSVFLAGDASHIHSPVGGQGMNTGLQDAANLVWKIAAVAEGAPSALLDAFGEERIAVGQALLERTGRGLAMATASNPLVEWIRDRALSIAGKFSRVQDALVGFISETDIDYRNSSMVKDCGGAGELKAGDRMPYLPQAQAAVNQPRHNLVLANIDSADQWTDAAPKAALHRVTDLNSN